MVAPIPIKVLSSKTLARTETFLRGWQNISDAEVSIIPGVYLNKSQIDDHSTKVFSKIYGRSMTIQELGCAKAHFLARMEISTSEIGGIIFEDDARFLEPETILSVAADFLNKHRGQATVLNLCESSLSPFRVNQLRKSVGLFGHSPLAVAYVLTPPAAIALNQTSESVDWVSDWPHSKVKHYICVPALVAHGDEESGSEIAITLNGRDLRHKSNVMIKILRFINPFGFASSLINNYSKEFIYFVFLAPLYWRIDQFKARLGNSKK
jgi:GR25 family glycosyltransferase involved in LPS biosynthesis